VEQEYLLSLVRHLDRTVDLTDSIGYFGPVPGSLLAQIGRGYTDLCAALCAVGLKASELQVWKEVDGIFTADPRKVPTARLVPVITPDEAAELTYYGSEVIHPFTMEQVIRARIPIRIKNVENPKGEGTIIYPDEKFPRGAATESNESSTVNYEVSKNELRVETKVPTAVTIKDNIIVLNIHSNRKTISHGFLARIFGTLDRAGVVVDLISTSEVHVSMAMQDISSKKRMDRLHKDLEKIGDITVSKDMAILSLVGKNMRHAVGCAGMMFTALAKAGINIEMISQGASEINISCGMSLLSATRCHTDKHSDREQGLVKRPQCHSLIQLP
jgi:aspartate kinase